ncbi:MAG: DUF4105 domain-containing protein [Prevotella sp.]|nr:DUF4105 domain-containing protein [Prevotella sp.]
MSRLAQIVIMAAWLLLPITMMAEKPEVGSVPASDSVLAKPNKAMLQPDYIRATLLVVDPSAEVYSVFGHCALRLQCPTQKMDYCFTFEMSTSAEDIISFFSGTAMGGFKPAPTYLYIDYYRQQGRGMTEYELNLLPTEKLQLWRTADEEIVKGFSRRYGYMHAQCTSMIAYLLSRALGTRIVYHELPEGLEGSFRDQMLEAGKCYPWSAFFWQSVMGSEGDDTEPLAHKLVPQKIAAAWQHATIGDEDRHLIVAPGQCIIERTAQAGSWGLSPTVVFTLLLLLVCLITLAQLFMGWRVLPFVTDMILLALHTVVGLLLLWLVLFSEQEGTSWNWYLLAFNPIPLLLWFAVPRWRKWTLLCAIALMVLTLVFTPFIPQLDLPHALLICCLAVRLLALLKTNFNINVITK